MSAPALLGVIRQAGVTISAEGGDLVLRGAVDRLSSELVEQLRQHKPEVIAALAQAGTETERRFRFNKCHDVRDLDRFSSMLAQAVEGTGLLPSEFRSLLSDEDLDDIINGDIALKALRAYARSFAQGVRSGRVRLLRKPSSRP